MAQLEMNPPAGHRMVTHAGDVVTFELKTVCDGKPALPAGWKARLRTNLGRADCMRREVVETHYGKLPLAGASWRDLPMVARGDRWRVTVPLTEVGYFQAKAYVVDENGFQHWPGGPDVGIHVEPSWTRTANTIYCAFPRMFGNWSKAKATNRTAHEPPGVQALDRDGFVVIPPSGTLRDVLRELPHILNTLNCRILHLLPVGPTPTTFARFGRFGSPYAVQDLTAIDPALVEFDQRTTGVDQFEELAHAVHARGARLFIDIVINHTGWGSREWNEHPDWFVRKSDGAFESPGAWGVVWEDLVEFDQRHVPLWDYLANAFLVWCRRGVDGFRCDAGYKVPVHVWQYITSRVRQEYPDTVFLLEGLGGPWDATESLLTAGGMQWAYSELFQNQTPEAIGGYLDHAFSASATCGVLVHYSETHDNARLAAHPQGLEWSRYRNRLCALTSVSGGFAFTCGVEWGAKEQIQVHSSRGLNWGAKDNLVATLGDLNRLLTDHPCFYDGARLQRVSDEKSSVYAMRRDSREGTDSVLVLVNLDVQKPQSLCLDARLWADFGSSAHDLLENIATPHLVPLSPQHAAQSTCEVELELAPGAVHCLSAHPKPQGLACANYRRMRACADWALRVWVEGWKIRCGDDEAPELPADDWLAWAGRVNDDPAAFLGATLGAVKPEDYRAVVTWTLADLKRVLLVPPGHWLLISDTVPFRVRLWVQGRDHLIQEESLELKQGYIAAFAPRKEGVNATLELERYPEGLEHAQAEVVSERNPDDSELPTFQPPPPCVERAMIRFLNANPVAEVRPSAETFHGPLVLLTNGRGAMTRIAVDLGRTTSKYDCLLGANLHPSVPVDRHVLAKRLRVWVNADGFITPLNSANLSSFEPGPPAHWRFLANAGNGRSVEIHLVADLLDDSNTLLLQFTRPATPPSFGRSLPESALVRLTVRMDLEDRNFHWETKRNPAAETHFTANCKAIPGPADSEGKPGAIGFIFQPVRDRHLHVVADAGCYHEAFEWSEWLPHPVEATRGMEGSGDGFSPGWFDIPLTPGQKVTMSASAEAGELTEQERTGFVAARLQSLERAWKQAGLTVGDVWGRQLVTALEAFLVRRDNGQTVIAGYPWFLDWGRDSLIAARGLLAAGKVAEVEALVKTFARFELKGTLPNSIHGEDASNRDTSDAPLWLGVVCEELAGAYPETKVETAVPEGGSQSRVQTSEISTDAALFNAAVGDSAGRTVRDVLRSIACGYLDGTSNGIRVDPESCLVWSPSHFTWMDTNHPAGTPREGYPVEIQVLWIRLLRLLDRLNVKPWEKDGETWGMKAARSLDSMENLFWLETEGWYSDCLLAKSGTPAAAAQPSNALRSNALMTVALDVVSGKRAQRVVQAALNHLVVPGALRSLAPLPVHPPHPIHSHQGQLLNDPDKPYWGRYEGDEDSRRKPAYHNGTAWGWTFPGFCEALAKAYPGCPIAHKAARAYLGSMDRFLSEGCLGQMPEVIDGDAPHTHRGCDAQAWTVSESLRVWRWLNPTITAPSE